jgi:hypothetical protein
MVAATAVAVALGGTSIAASFLPSGSVGTDQLRDQAVTNSRIANNAVGNKKLRDGSVTTQKIKDGTIRPVDFNWTTWSAIADIPGRQGAAGATGATGAAGAPGPAGATGATGAPGPAGASGGQTVLSGTGVPSASTGSDGDFYIDTASSVIYGPKASGAWPTPGTSMIGPQGDAGPAGPQGDAGPAGPMGGIFASGYGQWGSSQTQGGAAFAGGAIVPLTFNQEDITPLGVSVDGPPPTTPGATWRFTQGVWAGGFSAQIRKTGNGAAVIAVWWQSAPISSGCDEDSDFTSTPNSATRQRLSSAGEQTTMTVAFVFPVPAEGMCGRLVANSEGTGTEPQEMEIIAEPALGGRPLAPSVIANVWRIG